MGGPVLARKIAQAEAAALTTLSSILRGVFMEQVSIMLTVKGNRAGV